MDLADPQHIDRSEAERTDFGGLTIEWDERVLQPRAWTVGQSLWAAELVSSVPPGPVLELCCGAGQIGLLAVRNADRRLVCVDVDPVAASYAARNASAAGMGARTEIRVGGVDAVLLPRERFPLVIADPPWVPAADTGRFPADPLLAIDGGGDGTDVIRICVLTLELHLATEGVALLQLGSTAQAEQVGEMVRGGRLRAAEVREFEGGVVLRLDAHDG